MRRIESRNNPIIKAAASLCERSERYKNKLFAFEGVHLFEEFIRSGGRPYAVFVREDKTAEFSRLINGLDCDVYEVTEPVYNKLSTEKAPQGIFTVASFIKNVAPLENGAEIKGNALILDGLQDTGNVGTIIRTASAFGTDVILASCADIYSSKTVRATMGAMFFGRIYTCDSTEKAVGLLRAADKRVIATALYGKNEKLGGFDILPGDCFVIGNEGNGIDKSVLDKCDLSVRIPMTDNAESLNAAAAAAVILWEAKRKVL